jgi:hypothetical protein
MGWFLYSVTFLAMALTVQWLLLLIGGRVEFVRRRQDSLSVLIALLSFIWMAWFAVHVLKL